MSAFNSVAQTVRSKRGLADCLTKLQRIVRTTTEVRLQWNFSDLLYQTVVCFHID